MLPYDQRSTWRTTYNTVFAALIVKGDEPSVAVREATKAADASEKVLDQRRDPVELAKVSEKLAAETQVA